MSNPCQCSFILTMNIWYFFLPISRGGFRGRGVGVAVVFCNYFLFCNHLQAGDVSVSLASWKYYQVKDILPLKDISIATKRSQPLKF